jgi:transaldolase
MKATEKLHNAGQWLDNITGDLLTSGTLKRYVDTLSSTGVSSNPTIFDHAISKSAAYIRCVLQIGHRKPEKQIFARAASSIWRAKRQHTGTEVPESYC